MRESPAPGMEVTLLMTSRALGVDGWASILVLALVGGLGLYSWARRREPGALAFAWACLFGALWSAGSTLEALATSADAAAFWTRLQAVWLMSILSAETAFTLQFVGLGRWLRRRNVVLLAVVPILTAGFVATNSWHNLAWISPGSPGSPADAVQREFGPVPWALLGYSLALAVLNIAVLVHFAVASPRYRWAAALMVVANLAGHSGFLMVFTSGSKVFGLALDVLSIGLPFLLFAVALFAFRLFDPVPAARDAAVGQMSEGMVVLDSAGRVVDANAAAEQIVGRQLVPRRTVAADIFPSVPELFADDGRSYEGVREYRVIHGGAPTFVSIVASRLRGSRGEDLGDLLLLKDVTTERLAQARDLEHERVEATLLERERLANELHDQLGQMLAFVSMQTQAIRQWVREGDLDRADSLLARLSEVAQHAHADVRESILELKAGSWSDWSFMAALHRHLDDFRGLSGVATELEVDESWQGREPEPDVGVQVLRVLQEAMSNARRHAAASTVRVTLSAVGDRLQVTVADDGRGFDTSDPQLRSGPHFGLSLMRKRILGIGGDLSIYSREGAGTRVVLDVPLHVTSLSMGAADGATARAVAGVSR